MQRRWKARLASIAGFSDTVAKAAILTAPAVAVGKDTATTALSMNTTTAVI